MREKIEFFLDEYYTVEAIEEQIDQLTHTGDRTNIAIGLESTRDQVLVETRGKRPNAPNIVFVITDGHANINQERIAPAARSLRSTGSILLAIGVTDFTNPEELETIAGSPDLVFRVETFDELSSVTADVVEQACRNVPTVPPVPPTDDSGPPGLTTTEPPAISTSGSPDFTTLRIHTTGLSTALPPLISTAGSLETTQTDASRISTDGTSSIFTTGPLEISTVGSSDITSGDPQGDSTSVQDSTSQSTSSKFTLPPSLSTLSPSGKIVTT